MFLCYQLPDVARKTSEAQQTGTKFHKATLERISVGEKRRLQSFLTGACGRVIGTQEREVPCITIGLCIVRRYKCDALLISAAGGVEQCLTP